MDQKKMQIEEKAWALTLLEKEESVIAVAEDVGVARKANYQLKREATLLPPGMVPKRKSGSGATKKTLARKSKLFEVFERIRKIMCILVH